MRRLLRGREGAAVTAIEGRAHGGEIVDAGARLARHAERDLVVDDAGAGCDCILGVALGGIAFVDRRRDAALRPEGGAAGADRRRRENGDRVRRELQRAEHAGESAADDDDGGKVSRHSLIERDGGEPLERRGFLRHGGRDKRAGAFGQGQGERRGMALRRHLAQRLAEDVDDLLVVVAVVFCEEVVEVMFEKDDRRDIFQRLRFQGLSSAAPCG